MPASPKGQPAIALVADGRVDAHDAAMSPLERLNLTIPIVQAPMAGVSTPDMAAAVSNAGGLGSIALGASGADTARAMIEATRARTDRVFNVNVFVHRAPQVDLAREALWIEALRPLFAHYAATPPDRLETIYRSFDGDDEMLGLLLSVRPPVVSFHFGLPDPHTIAALKAVGCVLLATATNLREARASEAAGIDMIVAQGWEAGGHRGIFDPAADDERLTTLELARLTSADVTRR